MSTSLIEVNLLLVGLGFVHPYSTDKGPRHAGDDYRQPNSTSIHLFTLWEKPDKLMAFIILSGITWFVMH